MYYENGIDIDEFTEADLLQARKLKESYEEKQVKVLQDTLLGKYPEFSDMVHEYRRLASEYNDSFWKIMHHYPYNFLEEYADHVEDRSKNYTEGTKQYAFDYLRIMANVKRTFGARPIFENSKGQQCDEYGNPLSQDEEHRVFEVIRTKKD